MVAGVADVDVVVAGVLGSRVDVDKSVVDELVA